MAAKDRLDQFLEEHGDKVLVDYELWEHLKKDQERIGAILNDIFFDVLLVYITQRTFLRRDEEVRKLMNSINMVQKARLAYALGIINKTALNDFANIHNIRNTFAHSLKVDFTNTKVLRDVRKLSTAKGQDVTPKNSKKFYRDTIKNCQNMIQAIREKQKLL